ncbi:hypothetical protein RFI_32015 [Reticulomyxa filosa]|uniref:Uncharacterized protein n=1 Tax=Reticulomyxa filosa TaxID=46433 RepID=X6LW80_RETFI|nr:hypothetical protein RFI_32015 [Reticulomyxa filosa]|eukprot:ETO05382.1 hypothetical protein RFI_32015 [Reticulomyxa filosa]
MIKQLESRMQHYIQKSNCRKICKDEEWSNCVLIFDNILKMVTIFMKIRANTHVILMSETGCGKTFLIKFLGHVVNVLIAVDVHAGFERYEIRQMTKDCNERLSKDKRKKELIKSRLLQYVILINQEKYKTLSQ